MSDTDETVDTEVEDVDETAPESRETDEDEPVDWKAEAERWKAASRRWEARAKANAAAARELETLRAELAELKAAELDRTRREIAQAHGIPPSMLDRLRGETAEQIAADARALAAQLHRPARPVPDLRSAALPAGDGYDSDPNTVARAWLDRELRRG